MTRNQKIAIGCGSVGCLGLVVLIVVGGLFYWLSLRRPAAYSNYNSNYNSNSNENLNSRPSDSAASMSDDDKHRLFQAAGMTKDNELIIQVLKKIGLMTPSGTLTSEYQQFMGEHSSWGAKNSRFIRSVLTPEQARAYVDAHLND